MTLRTEAVPHSATRRCQPGALSSGARRSAQPHPAGLDDDETADQSHAEPAHSMRDGRPDRAPRPGRKANQDHPGLDMPRCVGELTEVFVLRKQNSRFTDRKAGDDRIVRTAHEVCSGRYVVSRRAQCAYDREVAALVREELHELVLRRGRSCADQHHFFVCDRIGGVAHGCLQVVARQPGVRIEQIRLGCALAQFAKQ